MRKNIHPKFYTNTKVNCACGNKFTTGSILEEIHVEVCSSCHPFYTGKLRIVDSMNVVKKFEQKREQAKDKKTVSRKDKRQARRATRTGTSEKAQPKVTLKDMLSNIS